ncbi:cell division cycle-associated protein 3 [Triplophysa rosa]|uniref:Cell division cycle-associated protein 3 n=1 Tax=Triplophysa rosa TaxID=992332 RepID=A0A9W8C2W6_TRIRA|nr:cell division cycle-associated protein 3 [Triplophysa rosa]KAI7806395.1 cell division cycle-associated protein 3 [Triplophysa rosa]
MGSSESKMSMASTPQPDPIQRLKAAHVARLADPRSPSCDLDRTPIQVGVAYSLPVVESVGPVFVDPRSPTPGVTRTPVKVSITSLARRLSTFFLNDVKTGDSAPAPLPPVSFTKHPSLCSEEQNDTSTKEHLLPLEKRHNLGIINAVTDTVSTPLVISPSEGYGSICSSPFVLLGETQAEVEVDSEPSLEEAEEALHLGNSPLRKELSLSLLACREGIYSSSLEEQRPLTPLPPSEGALNEDPSYGCFSIPTRSTENGTPAAEVISEADDVLTLTSEEQVTAAPEQSHEQPEVTKPSAPQPPVTSIKSSPLTNIQGETVQCGIRCPKFDTRSPSQAIFKPQWLGVGFGTNGVRARGVQARGKTTVSSPLSAKKPATNENNNMVVRTKQRPRDKVLIGEGRSPLQILKEANSPRDRNSQMKLKVATPEKQRFSQMDRRALILSLNKENE